MGTEDRQEQNQNIHPGNEEKNGVARGYRFHDQLHRFPDLYFVHFPLFYPPATTNRGPMPESVCSLPAQPDNAKLPSRLTAMYIVRCLVRVEKKKSRLLGMSGSCPHEGLASIGDTISPLKIVSLRLLCTHTHTLPSYVRFSGLNDSFRPPRDDACHQCRHVDDCHGALANAREPNQTTLPKQERSFGQDGPTWSGIGMWQGKNRSRPVCAHLSSSSPPILYACNSGRLLCGVYYVH